MTSKKFPLDIRDRRIVVVLLLLTISTLAHNPRAAFAQDRPAGEPPVQPKHILVLCSYGYALPAYQKFTPAFISVMEKGGIRNSDLFFEYLDLLHIRDNEHRQALADMLRHKYTEQNIDLIVTLHPSALSFLLDEAKDLLPNVPIMSWSVREGLAQEDTGHRILRLQAELDVRGTLERALELFPETGRVVFVSGVSEEDRQFERQAKSVFAEWEGRLQFEYTSGYSVEEVLQRVSNLPPRTVVIFWSIFRDKTGRAFTPGDVGRMVAKTANAPVFVLYDTLLGLGVIGGSLQSFEADGAQAAKLALDILNGKLLLREHVTTIATATLPMFDWQQIEKWGGKAGNLPEGTLFLNRAGSIWKQYQKYLIVFIVFVLAQSFLIVSLLMQRRRRKLAEEGLERHLEHLEETVKERTEDFRNQREWLRITLSSIGDAVIATDTEGRITFLNPVASELTGWQAHEAKGRMIDEVFRIINEQTQEPAENIVRHVLRDGRVVALANHTTLVARDARQIPIEDSAAPIMNEEGEVLGVVLVFHDVTEKRHARDALRESEEHYRSLFDNMLNGYAYCRMFFEEDRPKDFIYLNVNSAFETLTGLENVIGRKVSEVIPGIRESDPALFEIYGRVAKTGIPERFETYVEALGMWFSISVYSPRKEHFVAVFDVITERKLAEEELLRAKEEWERTFDSVPDLIAIIDARHRIVRANLEMAERLGVTTEQCIGLHCYEAVHGAHQPPESCPHARTLADGLEHVAEVHEERLGGDFLVSATPIRNEHGVLVGTVHVARDITERKQMERELRKSHDELELRVQERTAALERSNQALQDFASIASHDMREPLRKVISFGNMLRQKYKDSLGQTGNDYLNRMLNATERMQSLLTGLLEYSRVTTNPEPFREVDLYDVVHNVLSDLEIRIAKTAGEVKVAELPAIEADPTQMRQLFQNLIGNALKFHKAGERPIVNVRCIPIDAGNCQIIVEDNGIGFEEQYLERIFAPFQRLWGISEYEGTGMGLAICKKIVERHGGSITARSAPGVGSKFIVTLPVTPGKNFN